MRRLINTFKYGSWKTRLFFGTIALAFLGGAATIAVAAIAGLGIIPIAVGGAAMVLGLGMSTMVTVVSDENPENGEHGEQGENGENGEIGENGEPGGPSGIGEVGGQSENGEFGGQDGAKTQGKSAQGELIGNDEGGEKTAEKPAEKPAEKSAKNTENKAEADKAEEKQVPESSESKSKEPAKISAGENETLRSAVERAKKGNDVIYAEDDGRYVPDEIKEKAVAKAQIVKEQPANGQSKNNPASKELVMKRVKNTTNLSPSSGPYIDGLPPEKRPEPVTVAGTNEKKQDKAQTQSAGDYISDNTNVKPAEIEGEETEKKPFFKRLFSIFKKTADPEAIAAAEAAIADKQAKKKHLEDGKKTRKERKEIKKKVKQKTDIYGQDLEEKFENELSFADKEKLREEEYARKVEGRKEQARKSEDETANADDKTAENDKKKDDSWRNYYLKNTGDDEDSGKEADVKEKRATEGTGIKQSTLEEPESTKKKQNTLEEPESTKKRQNTLEESGSTKIKQSTIEESENEDTGTPEQKKSGRKLFKKLGGFFKNLFGNVYDEPEKNDDSGDDAGKKAETTKYDGEKTGDDTSVKVPERPKFKRRSKTGEILPDEDEENAAKEEPKKSSGKNDKDDKGGKNNPEEAPRPPRRPGEELDVSKYTASNMKKIIKAKKIGKDFIPVFIESWKSQNVVKTPALCYVKDDHVHFLLLEGDMERDVSVQTDKFINVWYQKNVPETDMKAYKNIKDNMGAYEMFKNVMPAFTSSTDQIGATSYTVNLYLLGKDIALAPPSMRELRKRFRFNTNIFDSLNTRGDYSEYFKKAYENKILWTDNVIGLQEYQRRIRAILQEMVNDPKLLRFDFREDVEKMVQFRLITDEYAQFYLNLKDKS
ncbi:MAG: hypothetical protein K6G45_06010 [Lachnospiraceae bacterium]|nr:hypothetical protein [Lachnospiraceae bacterium]